GAKRTPIGCFGGSLSTVSASDLGAIAISAAIKQSRINVECIDEVIVGNVLSAGQGMGPGRQAAVKAGIPWKTPALTLNMICGSGMKTIIDAAMKIRSGDMDVVVTAGIENMSQAPYLIDHHARSGVRMGNQVMSDSLITDGLTDAFNHYHMGITAENIARQFNITRYEQDTFALESQKRALKAIDNGEFEDEITPVQVHTRKGNIEVTTDEYPRRDSSLEKLSVLRPAFEKNGTVTAGNSSGINDGAAALILTSEKAIQTLELQPLAEIRSFGQGGVDASVMGLGPVPAIDNALKKAKLDIKDIDLFEINEAFAAQAIGVLKSISENHSVSIDWLNQRTNVNEGAIALGHPLGASGSRIVVSLLYQMIKNNKKRGLASLCIGGGMGTAVIIELCS
ncbi:TPA: acetyl-CoA C-acetyltransferase, partial [Escherichia coli]